MYTKHDLINQLEELGINRNGTVLVHSSFKSIGEVDGGPDTVLDSFIEYMQDGLLVLPTHTWAYINEQNPVFSVEDSKTNVGILTELFRKREGVVRSWHPTHSVAALGEGAEEFVSGAEKFDTPCARGSVWGKLLDNKAQIILLGVNLTRNTYIHGIEEWVDIPGRISDTHQQLYSLLPDGRKISVPSRRHTGASWSEHFWKVDEVLIEEGAMYIGKFGDAEVRVCDAERLNEVLTEMLHADPDLFTKNEPLSEEMRTFFHNKEKN
ncbi:AAC(3) family N-acetyltransferase [Jeotgalibaca ciconiae]|uniref:Aminoglycoside N(3)-acetyltransferase n=1 Tax=Jeotgalibaca ciconiae TaxID=2496265 RepID=A0A3Q9BJX8_9LACT|nr:AAC(3) family N-acetyltransferase [Jeotgalibaca ciconiae]AZP04093.1 AAC(3) family N-acetyltransferase [Jeotgalibaca ciconiae]HJB22878.1 AAC(3) family N-acetyltransferase [Candidatus Jeotgalibaca pullicola]